MVINVHSYSKSSVNGSKCAKHSSWKMCDYSTLFALRRRQNVANERRAQNAYKVTRHIHTHTDVHTSLVHLLKVWCHLPQINVNILRRYKNQMVTNSLGIVLARNANVKKSHDFANRSFLETIWIINNNNVANLKLWALVLAPRIFPKIFWVIFSSSLRVK